MEARHTPGPWHWDSDPVKGDPLGRVRYRVVTVGKTITQTYYSSSDQNAKADARLIAAAPELLEALIELLREAHFASKALHPDSVASRKARAAIAKAEGNAS